MAGYIDMISCMDDLSNYDLKEVIDVLSVPEMKEILKELQKVLNLVLNIFFSALHKFDVCMLCMLSK